ncbi:MAG: sensor domain-containing diguanylate cyclase [Solibacillus sp.]|uniref:sensor domain-containing diguanylate cyclase n=1 Tax=Solibacillus sp. TaxID=1909654 RepID=UPI003315BEFE
MEHRLANIPCGYIALNDQFRIVEVNETFLQWTSYAKQVLMNQHIEKLFTSSNKLIFHSYFYPNMLLYKHVDELFIHVRGEDGKTIPCLVNAIEQEIEGETYIDMVLMPMKKRIDYEKEVRKTKQLLEQAYSQKTVAYEHLQYIYEKIELKQAQLVEINKQLVEISNTDNLTGIANRRYFQEQLTQLVSNFHEQGQAFSLLVIDIDYFKQVNDTHGHPVGDLVLAQLGLILKMTAREQDTVARFGGEEFVLLLGETAEVDALEIAQQLNKVVEETIWPTIGRLTVSIGCTTYKAEDTEGSVFEHADEALYASKRNGRNCTTQYEAMRKVQ